MLFPESGRAVALDQQSCAVTFAKVCLMDTQRQDVFSTCRLSLSGLPVELLHLVLAEAGIISTIRLAQTSKYFYHSILLEPSRDLSFAWLCLRSFHFGKGAKITPPLPKDSFKAGLAEDSFFVGRDYITDVLARGWPKVLSTLTQLLCFCSLLLELTYPVDGARSGEII
jgi:hypothetical protein